MLDLIKDISSSKGIHVILSSHLLPDVEWVCEEALVIDKGRRMAAGKIDELKRGVGAVFECRVRGNAEAFMEELRVLGCRCIAGDEGILKIHMGDGLGSQSLLRVARDHHVQIRHLVPLKQSLEDVFLQAIGESDARL
jgi:ABC-2 type transport system ATP-binding protein